LEKAEQPLNVPVANGPAIRTTCEVREYSFRAARLVGRLAVDWTTRKNPTTAGCLASPARVEWPPNADRAHRGVSLLHFVGRERKRRPVHGSFHHPFGQRRLPVERNAHDVAAGLRGDTN